MNGMKKLLGVIGILGLAAALLPAQGYADLRGAFAPLTIASGFVNGCEQPAFRPGNTIAVDAGTQTYERWFAFSTRSLVPGHEQVRSIWLHLDSQQSGVFAALLNDPSATISYADPAWSYDGKYLAYAQLNEAGTESAIYVQEFMLSNDVDEAATAIGYPILVVALSPGTQSRHPAWSKSGYTLAYDSNVTGLSSDVYTKEVFPTAGDPMVGPTFSVTAPVRRTFDNTKAEVDPTWSPNGHDICFATNQFGPNVLEIIDLNLASNDPGYTRLAETNFNFISHNHPSYTSDGNGLMYDAPAGEDPNGISGVWLLDLLGQTKCEVLLDPVRANSDPDVSGFVNSTQDGFTYNGFIFTSQAGSAGGSFGVATWRGNPVTSCLAPLPMAVQVFPAVYNAKSNNPSEITTILSFPQQTIDAGYQSSSGNGPLEGVRLRASILPSPTLMGLNSGDLYGDGVVGTDCYDDTQNGQNVIRCVWDHRTIVARVTALGLLDQVVPMKMTAYSNWEGRGFQGYGYVKFTKSSLSGSVALLGNSPNPFNPVTTIKFQTSKAGNVTLRIYDVRGALVRTLAKGHYEAGVHEVTWDGLTARGGRAASGVYYAKITGADNDTDSKRLVMAK
jgi:Tol biopolymer transport system component